MLQKVINYASLSTNFASFPQEQV